MVSKALDDSTEVLDIIVGSGNMMSAAKIDPFHLRIMDQIFLHHLQCALQRIHSVHTWCENEALPLDQ